MKNVKLKAVITLCILLNTSFLFSQDVGVYVSDAGNFQSPPWFIWQFTETAENPVLLLDENDGIVWPQDILFIDDDDTVLISSLSSEGIIQRYSATTWEFIENFAEGINGPTRMEIGPEGYVYVLQWSNTDNKVLRYEIDGTFVDEFTSIGVPSSIGLDWDASGNLYVSSYNLNYIQKFDTNGNDLGPFIDTGLNGPTNIFFDNNGSGDLIVLNWDSGIVKRFDSDGNFVEDLITDVPQCEGVDFFPNGDMLMGVGGSGSSSEGSVKRYDSDFNFIEDFIEDGLIDTPNSIAIHEGTLGVEDLNSKGFSAYPNPVTDILNLRANEVINSVSISNILGQTIYRANVGSMKSTIDMSSYSSGTYFVNVQIGDSIETDKILK
jgi:hypothetical protein